MKVFVDTAAWIALLNTDDDLHIRVRQVRDRLSQQEITLITTEFVLLEVADGLSTPKIRSRTVDLINRLRSLDGLQILPLSQVLTEGWLLYSQRPDKGWSLTDCISFIVMTQQQITQAFTSDHHFE